MILKVVKYDESVNLHKALLTGLVVVLLASRLVSMHSTANCACELRRTFD